MRARQGPGSSRWWSCAAWCVAVAAFAPSLSSAQGDVRIVAVEPGRPDSALTCTVLTAGLPDARSRETLASGLPSALTLSIALLDERGRERSHAVAEVRIEPDPWERAFVVRAPFGRLRVANLDELSAQLRRLGPLPLPLPAGGAPREARVRVRLAVHPLAPAEADRARSLYVGGAAGNGAERREVSAGMGTLLRWFVGRAPESAWRAEGTSAPFEPRAAARDRSRGVP